ncbi:MAG TPA: alpha-glucan family phosphorylase [Candidatus Cloacimonadota bacterium]|jgi:starch phosphorylase|nr:alpha-glucan family phosphorylase [Candidatus Cloacimonadota bacterium]
MRNERTIAYFTMEIALDDDMPTYSGGLGVLAGDTIRSAADLSVPLVGITLLHRKGYFYQHLDENGWQREEAVQWVIEDYLKALPQRADVAIEGRNVLIRPWLYEVVGIGGFKVPVYFLDTDLAENDAQDRSLTDHLYGGDERYRLCQEIVLGIGGARILRSLGYDCIKRYHMNEGHSGLLTMELLDQEVKRAGRIKITQNDIESVRKQCVFTTHTPVPAGHDQFPMNLVRDVLRISEVLVDLADSFSSELVRRILRIPREYPDIRDVSDENKVLNMTYLALNLSHYINGVAKKHGEVSRLMYAGYHVDAITNGVHAATWTSEPFQELYDRYIPGWKLDNFNLRYALSIPKNKVWNAHMTAKKTLLEYINRETNCGMGMNVMTIGFARRATSYKRGDLLFRDIERLKYIAAQIGPFQIIYAGKAHPRDDGGKTLIQRIQQAKNAMKGNIKIVYLENYDLKLAKMLTSGVDIWLNTPQVPREASGTSGMKAALNGIPSFSVLDGWWHEGHIEGLTGWSIGDNDGSDEAAEVTTLYEKLEKTIIPIFYHHNDHFLEIMRHCIAINGSFFNTHRMIQQYVLNAYYQ